MAGPVTVVVSSRSGRGKALRRLPELEGRLRSAGVGYRIEVVDTLDDARTVASEAATLGECLAIAGGDGFLHALLPELANTEIVTAVVPLGSGNDFARNFGIRDIERAVEALCSGQVRAVDLGRVGDRWFATIACLGLDSEVLRIVDRTKLVKGPIVYPVSTLRALRSWKPASFVVTVDGKSHDLSGHNVVVANTPWYGGGMRMAPNADAGDGCLSVVVIGNLPKWRLLWHSPKVFSGTHVSLPEVRTFSGKHISIASNRNFSVFADGERVGSTPVDIDVVPGALRMIVPVS